MGRRTASHLSSYEGTDDLCIEQWRTEFSMATSGREQMNLLQFMKCTACRSRYYAVKLFDILDLDESGTISFDEYCDFMKLLCCGSSEALGTFAFNLFDADKDGIISRAELRQGLVASVEESETVMTANEVTKLVDVLEQLFTDATAEAITREKFVSVLQSYPDVLGNFTIGDGARSAKMAQNPMSHGKGSGSNKFQKAWRKIQDKPKKSVTNMLTVLVIIVLFVYRFAQFARDCNGADLDYVDPFVNVSRREVADRLEEVFNITMTNEEADYMSFSMNMSMTDPLECSNARKRKLLGWTLPVAKGCGQALKAVFTLILFPVSRTLMTKLRRTFLKNVFDFDNAIAYHRLLGKIGFVLSWVHTLCHIVNIYHWQNEDLYKQWSFAFPEDRTNSTFSLDDINNGMESDLVQGVPPGLLRESSEQPTVLELLSTPIAVTGIILTVTYTIAVLFAFDYPKGMAFFNKAPGEKESSMSRQRKIAVRIGTILNDFNYFWYTHHLFVIFYVAMIFHPLPHVPHERTEWPTADAWIWIIIPVIFYSMERIDRALQSSKQTSVIGLRLLPGRVVELNTTKPEGFNCKAGQYIFVNCYQIAPFEWHPFTLTSAPHDPYLSVHIRSAGDWTNALYTAAKNYKEYSESPTDLVSSHTEIETPGAYPFNIKIAGPYGAPAQCYDEFRTVICIGAGIGVTPFASVLNSVLHSIRTNTTKLHKVYFHWTVRSRKEACWFKKLLEEISADDTEGILEINIHITSLKEVNDLRMMLLRLAEFEDIDQERGKVVTRSITRFGRPDWSKILRRVQLEHLKESKIGVFFCGPSSLARVLKAECIKRSCGTTPKFVFRKEVF